MAAPQKQENVKPSEIPATADKGRTFVTKSSEVGATGATGFKPHIGYFATFIHLVKGYVGTGIFAMGEALKFSGHSFGLVLLFTIAVINLNCQHMLLKAAAKIAEEEEEEVRPTFSETVEYSIDTCSIEWLKKRSHKLGWATTVFLLFAELGFCCVYFVFIAEHLIEITSEHGFLEGKGDPKSKHIMLAIILIPMWLSTFMGNLKLLMPLSLTSNILMWTGIVLIMYFIFKDGAPDEKLQFISNCKSIHRFFGITLFAFEGITFVIPLRNEMKDPSKFISPLGVLNVGMFFVYFLYSLVGFLAYWKYGDGVKSSVFLNLPHKDVVAKITKAMISLGVMLTFTLHMYIPFEITYPLFHRKYGPFKHELLVKCIYRTVPVLLTYTLANVVPFLGLFISLVGATTGAVLALILPPVIELIAFKGKLHIMEVIKNYIIIFLGVIGLLFGTVLSIIDIVREFKKYY